MMKKRINRLKIILLIITLIFLSSCSDRFLADNPEGTYAKANSTPVMTNAGGVGAVMDAIECLVDSLDGDESIR